MNGNWTPELAEMLDGIANDLAAEINDRYGAPEVHPALKIKYERDMEPVRRAVALLARIKKDTTP